MDATKPSLSVIVKLGSIVVHVDELLSPDGRNLDKEVILNLMKDTEVKEWIAAATKAGFLPVKRQS